MSDTTVPAPPFLDAPDFQEAKRKKGAVQDKAEWSFQANLHKFLERVVHAPCEIRGFDKAGAQRWVGAWSKAVARGIKDGTGDHLVAQGAPRRLLWIECKGKTDATPAQIGTADAYERCGIPTVRECRTMAQALVGLRDAGFRLHGNADNLAIEYQARADASLRELVLRKTGAPKKKRASSGKPRPFTDSRPSRRSLAVWGKGRLGL